MVRARRGGRSSGRSRAKTSRGRGRTASRRRSGGRARSRSRGRAVSRRGRRSRSAASAGRRSRSRLSRSQSSRSRSSRSRSSRSRSSSSRSRSAGASKFTPQNFSTKIKQIGEKAAPGYVIQTKTLKLISSFLNEIIKNVTQKAKENVQATGKKTITYMDVLVATMNLFGDDNKWIAEIMKKGMDKSKRYEDKIGFKIPKVGRDPADDLPDDVIQEEE